MALPGKRHPRSLTRHRRSAWMRRFKPGLLQPCPKCKTPKLPHQVCQVCGTYKGVKVLDVKHHTTRAERRAAEKAAAARAKAEQDHKHEDDKKK